MIDLTIEEWNQLLHICLPGVEAFDYDYCQCRRHRGCPTTIRKRGSMEFMCFDPELFLKNYWYVIQHSPFATKIMVDMLASKSEV